MKLRKALILKITGIVIALSIFSFAIVCTVIANSVISSMSDVRIVTNDGVLADYGLVGEQISVVAEDGTKINAYLVPNLASKGNVIILHGMHGMDATSLFDYASFIFDGGYTPIVVDMRAHGKSEGESLSFGYLETQDVTAVIDYLRGDSRFRSQPIIIYGLSMGGSTAINTAALSDHVDGIVAVSPFLSYQAQVSDYMKRDGAPAAFVKTFEPFVNLILWNKFGVRPVKDSPAKGVAKINDIPIFFVHGDQDTQTALYHTEVLFENCGSKNKELWIVAGTDHLIVEDVLSESSKYYRDRILAFLDSNFSN